MNTLLLLLLLVPALRASENETPLFLSSAPIVESTATPVAPVAPVAPPAAARAAVAVSSAPRPVLAPPSGSPRAGMPPLRGIHMTGWAAGSPKARREIIGHMNGAGLNAIVIALKETDGLVFVRGTRLGAEAGSYVNAIPDLPAAVRDFKDAGIYTIGRIVLFKDDKLARRRPDLAVKRPNGAVWANKKGVAWVDPYLKEVWEYNLDIASRAAVAGFDEIQLDYIRFPSDGDISQCRYSRKDHTARTAGQNIIDFIKTARQRIKPLGPNLSICVFGMTTTDDSGMGIGQRITEMAREVDFISPMMYPSHYYKGEYGLKDPNRQPYKTIQLGVRDALLRLGAESWKLRPYYQDFTLGFRYTAEHVRAQILASETQGVTNWLLWNPQNKYTWSAFQHNNKPIFREHLP